MDQLYPDSGLTYILLAVIQNGFTWHLFTNDFLPQLDDTLDNYTEAAWSGYAPQFVEGSTFVADPVSGHVGAVEAPPLAWVNSSPRTQSVCGYFVTDSSGTVLIAAARFDDAPRVVPQGSGFTLAPVIANYSGLSS